MFLYKSFCGSMVSYILSYTAFIVLHDYWYIVVFIFIRFKIFSNFSVTYSFLSFIGYLKYLEILTFNFYFIFYHSICFESFSFLFFLMNRELCCSLARYLLWLIFHVHLGNYVFCTLGEVFYKCQLDKISWLYSANIVYSNWCFVYLFIDYWNSFLKYLSVSLVIFFSIGSLLFSYFI